MKNLTTQQMLVLGGFAVIAIIGLILKLTSGTPSNPSAANVAMYGSESATPSPTPSPTPEPTPMPTSKHIVTLKTNFGDISFQTYDDDAPKTVQNFITLAQKGFYNNLSFHRVISEFMIQGGDPKGDGTSGPGYQFDDELNPKSLLAQEGYKKGVVAMANAGPNTNGSQFFIMLENYPLPFNYTIFGKVTLGQDVVDKIGQVKTDSHDKPLSPVTIQTVTVTDVAAQ